MNHFKQYVKLIRKAQKRGSGVENHHIFPRSIFGENDSTVMLTMREHWIAHKLLFSICLKRYGKHNYTYKMANAMLMMCNRTSREYESARQYFVENHHTKTKEHRKQLSDRMRGVKNTLGMKMPPRTEEYKQRQRETHNKTYEITYDNGEVAIVHGMKQFARNNDYNHSHLIQIGKGNRKRHKNIIGVKQI